MLLILVVSNELNVLLTAKLPPAGIAAILLSCVGGLGMSYFSFALRAVISATSFSVIGNICKVLTILVNLLMWEQHASEFSLPLLSSVCLISQGLVPSSILPHTGPRKHASMTFHLFDAFRLQVFVSVHNPSTRS